MVKPLLAIEDLSVERGGRLVLSQLSFDLLPGETILVSGRNGSGKSTLLRTLSGLLRPTAGRIRYGLADDETRGVETVHYLGYEDALKPSLTVGENLDFWSRMLGAASSPTKRGKRITEGGGGGRASLPNVEAAAAPSSTLRVVRLPFAAVRDIPAALAAYGIAPLHDLPAAYLSAGQKRRVALARLLLARRSIWLLDEPLIALDTSAQETVVAIMAAHTAAGGAILLASHQPLEVTRRIELDT